MRRRDEAHMTTIPRYPLVLIAFWCIGMLIVILGSLHLTDGHWIYSLDDPYIHLAVAENILHGGYGINLGEYSSPSSSLLYPFLLAITEWLHLGEFGPLILNLFAMTGAVYTVGKILEEQIWDSPSLVNANAPSMPFQLLIGILFCALLNAWALVCTGMEQSLHVFVTMIVFRNILKMIAHRSKQDFRPHLGLAGAVAVLPLLRLEGMAFAILAMIALTYFGHRRHALLALGAIALTFAGWYFFTHVLGLPALPSSVQVKFDVADSIINRRSLPQLVSSIFATILFNLHFALSTDLGWFFLLALAFNVYAIFVNWTSPLRYSTLGISGMALLTGLAHLFFSKLGGWRYETYAVALLSLAAFSCLSSHLTNSRWRVGLLFTLLILSYPYWLLTWRVPLASQNIYQQQYQMHRFAVEYWKKPIAVNDLGWVSYQNPEYVLDLWGLGSEEARRILGSELARIQRGQSNEGGTQASKLADLVTQKNVRLIMIYDDWFRRQIPPQWYKIAVLTTPMISVGYSKVSFYTTSRTEADEVRHLLREFAPTLPSGANLHFE